MRKKLPFLEAIAVVVGTIIGAGIIGLPYVFAQSGFMTASLILVLVASALLIVRLMLGEVVMRTHESHQLTGYTETYLGPWLKHIQGAVLIAGIYGTLLAYMVGQGDILSALLGGPEIAWSLGFYLAASFLVIHGLEVVKRSELIMLVGIFFIMIMIALFSVSSLELAPLMQFDHHSFFVPFGVILFACAGLVAVPEAWGVVKRAGREHVFKHVLIWGGIIPPILYFIFVFFVVGVTGEATTPVATVGLGDALGPQMMIMGNVFAFFAVATSFLTIALAQGQIFREDYRISQTFSSALVITVPLVVFALGLRDFIEILGFVGSLTVGINGILAVVLFWRARTLGERTPEYVVPRAVAAPASIFLVIVFAAGIAAVFV